MKIDERGIAIPSDLSPLPWKDVGTHGFPVDARGFRLIGKGYKFEDDDDARYAIHAANHHRDLVVALCDLIGVAELQESASDPTSDIFLEILGANMLLDKIQKEVKGGDK